MGVVSCILVAEAGYVHAQMAAYPGRARCRHRHPPPGLGEACRQNPGDEGRGGGADGHP